jgi:hypothetical protein
MVMGTDQLQYPYQLSQVRDFLKKAKVNAIAARRCYMCVRKMLGIREDLILRGTRSSSFRAPRNLSHHMETNHIPINFH